MRKKPRFVRYHVIVIPEARQRVVRFRLPRFMLFIVPALILALAISLYVLKDKVDQSPDRLQALEETLSQKESGYVSEILSKNREIEKLRGDLARLSEEAENSLPLMLTCGKL